MNAIKAWAISSFLNAMLSVLDGPIIKRGLDAMLDAIEDAVAKSETQMDNELILPLINRLRVELDIPDNDNQ